MQERDESADVVAALRSEAAAAKQCFTQYSFQAMAVASTILGASLGAMNRYPYAVYAPLPAIALLMAVCRMSIFKYATANRNHGYELHLSRTKHLEYPFNVKSKPRWRSEMRLLAWEEALRAWRVVQPTLFRRIYRTPQTGRCGAWLEETHLGWVNSFWPRMYRLHPDVKRALVRANPESYPWFLPGRLAASGNDEGEPSVVYYAGSYLKTVLSLLAFAQLLMLLPLILSLFARFSVANVLLVVFCSALIMTRSARISRRREILEDELLSIHSCAIVWQAVVMAHFAARDKTDGTYYHYTERLAEEARDIARHALRLHQWLGQGHSTVA